jgi:hypothetical protein
MHRRYALRAELERLLKNMATVGAEDLTENCYISILRGCSILKEVYFDPDLYVNSPDIRHYHVYTRLVHAVELLNGLEYLLRGLSMKEAVGMALRWRWDKNCITPEEEIFNLEEELCLPKPKEESLTTTT